jgi:glutathione synthase/RimK-type ligase-like ATP-grasp enzyme
MGSIGVFFNEAGFNEYPFNDPDYREAYADLGEVLHRKGVSYYLFRSPATYLGANQFSRGWLYGNGRFEEVEGPIEVDLIYRKGSKLVPTDDANVLNKRAIEQLCSDKMRICELFPELFPRTLRTDDEAQARSALEKVGTDWVVLKPVDGWGGSKIWIGPKSEAMEHIEPYPVLIQEYIDTSGGIPGFPGLKHDFRTIIMNGKVLTTFLRIPKEGSFISNVGKGGHVIVVPPEKCPAEPLEFARIVDKEFQKYGNRMYSVDCAMDRSGTWKLIELNDQPGLMTREDFGKYVDEYYDRLSDFLISCGRDS